MIQNCKFNAVSDIEKVVPALAPDVSEIMATGVVPSTSDSTPYTKETDIKEVGHYLRDKIQTCIAALNLQKSMAQAAKGAPGASSSSPGTGSGQPSAAE